MTTKIKIFLAIDSDGNYRASEDESAIRDAISDGTLEGGSVQWHELELEAALPVIAMHVGELTESGKVAIRPA